MDHNEAGAVAPESLLFQGHRKIQSLYFNEAEPIWPEPQYVQKNKSCQVDLIVDRLYHECRLNRHYICRYSMPIIKWGEAKRLANIKDHGIDFRDCEEAFVGHTVTIEDRKTEYGETRFVTIGLLKERVVVIAHTEFNESIRIISARKAVKQEREFFFRSVGNRLGSPRFAQRRRH